LWNELTWGQLRRCPDILASYIISALHPKDQFSAVIDPKCGFGENLENYYHYCTSHDLFLTHPLGAPGRVPCPRNCAAMSLAQLLRDQGREGGSAARL